MKLALFLILCINVFVPSHSQSNSHLKNDDGTWKNIYEVIKNNGTADDIQQLISNGADPNAVVDDSSALKLAAGRGLIRTMEILIEYNANIDFRDKKDGSTPLFNAVINSQEQAAEFLIRKGANVNLTNTYEFLENSPLHIAVYFGHQNVIDMLIEYKANVNATNRHFDTPLTYASMNGNLRTVRLLIDKKANVNAVNKYKRTPIILAANGGFGDIVTILAENGANVNAEDRNGNTALLRSVEKGLEGVVTSLIKHAALINHTSYYGDSALTMAIEKKYPKIAQILIENGADINALNSDGEPALTLAAEKRLEQIFEQLIENGANVNVSNSMKQSPLILALNYSFHKSIQKLLQRGADVNYTDPRTKDTPIILAGANGLDDAVVSLIQHGADVNSVNDAGNSALILVSQKGNEKIAEILIKNKANLNIVNKNGDSALKLAAIHSRDRLVSLLLKNGADPVNTEIKKTVEVKDLSNNLLNGNVAQKACILYTNLTIRRDKEFDLRIAGGELARVGEFPWMAALGYLNRQYKISFSCGGTLISDTFVLTAAHCVKDIRRPVVVRLGKISLLDEDGSSADNQNIREIIRHPKYSITKKKNDIALIRLTNRIWFSELIRPACLQTDLTDEDESVSLTVTGWGQTTSNRHSTSNELLKTEIRTVSLPKCNATLLEYNVERNLPSFRNGISESQYCAYDIEGKRDSCQGDSGGPLQILPHDSSPAKVLGVVSFGITCGNALPSIYTRVAFFADWIASYVWPNGEITTPLINFKSD